MGLLGSDLDGGCYGAVSHTVRLITFWGEDQLGIWLGIIESMQLIVEQIFFIGHIQYRLARES